MNYTVSWPIPVEQLFQYGVSLNNHELTLWFIWEKHSGLAFANKVLGFLGWFSLLLWEWKYSY